MDYYQYQLSTYSPVDPHSPVLNETQEEADLALPASNLLIQAVKLKTSDQVFELYLGQFLRRYFVDPIYLLGILANIVVVWVWSSESEYHPTTYLFKALAVSDGISLMCNTLYRFMYGNKGFFRDFFIHAFIKGAEKIGALITLLLAVVRVIRVFFPLRAEKLLSRRRMTVVLAGFTLWSLTLDFLVRYLKFDQHIDQYKTYLLIDRYLGSMLTLIGGSSLQVILMIAVTWRVLRPVRVESSALRPAVSFQQDKAKARRLVYTVFAMSVFTFIPNVVMHLILKLFIDKIKPGEGRVFIYYRKVYTPVFTLMRRVNESVNVFLYYFFIGKFKALLLKKLRESRVSITSPSFYADSGSSLPEGMTMSTDPDGDKIIIRKEAANDVSKSIIAACSFETTEEAAEISSSAAPTGLKEESGSVNTYIT